MRHILSVVTIFQYCTESVQLEVFSNMYNSRNFQASKHSLFLVWGSRLWFWEEWHIKTEGAKWVEACLRQPLLSL